jgi:hypothetical protein
MKINKKMGSGFDFAPLELFSPPLCFPFFINKPGPHLSPKTFYQHAHPLFIKNSNKKI